ncbi:MAG TPA: putative baseplate assembly protein [Kofleriaceae bacterium]|nr:putative baseplate assembly protein [Kofleriaceae bacterium]
MAQFRCQNENRRLLILAAPTGATLNGIDSLEVLDDDGPAGAPRQQTLLVRLYRPVPATLGRSNVVIAGGVREPGVDVRWAQPASAITVPGEDAAWFAAVDQPDHVLVVRTDKAGDFSTYRLSLVASPATSAPPAGFDAILSTVELSFKVQCPASFDCAPAACAPLPAEEPALDYLAKDYASFRGALLDRLSAIAPDWSQRSPADPGIAVVEALAYVGDHLSYQQDAVATEAYLETARSRVSVRRHARLLDYFVHEGNNARTWVVIDTPDDGIVLRRRVGTTRTVFLTRAAEPAVVSEATARTLLSSADPPLVFEPMHELALYRAHGAIRPYTFGDAECCLARGATRAALRDDLTNRLRLAPGDVLILEEVKGVTTGAPADADPDRRHAVRLTAVTPAAAIAGDLTRTAGPAVVDPITGVPYVELEWHADDALPAPFCLSKTIGGAPVDDITVFRGNAVLVDHGWTRDVALDPPSVPPSVPANARYYPRLVERGERRTPIREITHAVSYDDAAVRSALAAAPLRRWVSARAARAQDPRAAIPQIALASPGATPWTARRDLLGSDPFATDFVVEVQDGGEARLRFGDGTLGREPESGLSGSVRTGLGRLGNAGAGSIAHVVHPGLTATSVRNPLAATGGTDPEPITQVKLYAPHAFRTQERAVTEADYAAALERHDEVQKAMATRRWTGSWYTMFITVDRRGGRPVDAAFEAELVAHLERYRLAGHDVEIEPPRMVPLDLRLVACVKPGYFREDVRRGLLSVFAATDLPGGGRGFFHADNFTFGQPVYLSQVIGAAMTVAGVDWVDPTDTRFRFQRFAKPAAGEIASGRIDIARLEIARLDNSPSLPENGRLELVLMGGR